jgi:stage II sporulation protein AA (anti-sigma F factor antagonist)
MEIRSSFENGRLTIHFEGELDDHAAKKTAAQIEEKIDTLLPREALLDFKRLTFMDSSGIAVVLKTYRRMRQLGGTLAVINVGQQPRRVLDAAHVERIVKISAMS